jgi:DNA-binding beta-propeller fold protein YncE
MYVGSDLSNFWYVVNPRTGALITTVRSPLSTDAHNLNLSADGKTAFMSPNGKVMGIADTSTNALVKTIVFPDNIRVFVLNHDSSLIYSNTNNLLGFEIADVKTGKMIQRVDVQGFGWPEKWNATLRSTIPHGCPSHGIALTNGEKEVWLADGINNYIHVFDNTTMPPRQIASIKTTAGPYWITVGLDGKFAYVSSGDIIDMKTRKIVAQMKDEYGRTLHSEKLLDMTFDRGKLTRVANQFGNGISAPWVSGAPGTASGR